MRQINNDYSTHVNFPDTIKVHEHRAPTDESIRLLDEMHDKVIKNIIAKVKVEDNLVNGECFLFEQPWSMRDLKVYFKFRINNQEFTVEKELDRFEFLGESQDINNILIKLKDYSKSVMLWYALKKFTQVAYEQITKEKVPDYLIK